MSKLTIYKASAGSGKTYTLTEEYLKIIFKNIRSYRNILAVTFTNKAANEMKTRILKEVNIIAKGEKSPHIKEIIKHTGKTQQETIIDAKEIQNYLLHDYSFFSVKTIDSFFQDIIKSFTKEIGLQMGFKLELDSTEILDKSIEKVIQSIEKDKEIKKWFLSFARDKIKEGKRWNFKNDIAVFSQEIFKEKFTEHKSSLEELLKDRKFLSNFKSDLNKKKEQLENKVVEIGEKAVLLIETNGLEIDDFSRKKSGFINYFYKFKDGNFAEPGKLVLEAQNNVEKWYTKTSDKKDEIEQFYNSGANDLLIQAIDFYQNNIEFYNSLKIVSSLLNVFGIITDISRAVTDISFEENLFLISYAAPFINSIIDDNESPFIYEKIGARYKYFMIDEFQDTSSIQWNNFKPLIADNLAEGNSSLIVGDVKQSIYRWRNSDWKLLSENIYKDFDSSYIKDITLENNYRSKKEIIEFNNKIFTKGKSLLQHAFNELIVDEHSSELEELKTKIINAYAKNEQEFPGNKKGKGYIKFERILKDGNDQKQYILEKIPKILIDIQNNGYQLKDVAFLVRTKHQGAEIVDYLMQYKNDNPDNEYNLNVISNEALFLGNSPVIKLLIALLKDISSQKEQLNRVFIKYEYEIYLQESNKDLHNIFSDKDLIIYEYDKIKESLSALSFYEIIEKLIDVFNLNNKKDDFIYLQAFNDLVKDFASTKEMNIVEFIEWWEEKGYLSSVSVNENQDAAQIITIHKSKGLEFKIVIIPFADWDLNKSGDILWSENEKEPFNKLTILPVKYSSTLQKSYFYKDFYNELLQQFVDNLNLAYVAFTRAEDVLYIFSRASSKENSKNKDLKNIGDLINSVLEDEMKENIFEYGEFEKNTEKQEKADDYKLDEYLANKSPKSLNLKYQSKNFFSKDAKEKINKGLLYHKIFENIAEISDIEESVQTLINEGNISQKDKHNFVIEIKNIIKNLDVEHWFDGTYKVKNETSILYNNEVKRPDRLMFSDKEVVIVDYKFGDKEHSSYKKQLQDYKEIIRNMGYDNIKSYIWYVNKNNIVEI